jgi:hypothetical protein
MNFLLPTLRLLSLSGTYTLDVRFCRGRSHTMTTMTSDTVFTVHGATMLRYIISAFFQILLASFV